MSEELKDKENMQPESEQENRDCGEAAGKNASSETAEGAEGSQAEESGAEEKTGADGEQAEEGGEESQPEKKGFFARKKDKRDQQIEELTDRLKRTMAEFDNFRKRTEKEKSAMYEIGAKDVIEKILPIVDNFERGLSAVPEGGDAFAEGMNMIYRQLLKTLEELGVKPIEAVGQPFDPNFHNAVMHIEDESLGENVVAEEFLKGYLYRDSVVRHSMVKVAN